jgi:hypothetical protein
MNFHLDNLTDYLGRAFLRPDRHGADFIVLIADRGATLAGDCVAVAKCRREPKTLRFAFRAPGAGSSS